MSFINREIERGILSHAIMMSTLSELEGLSEADFGDTGTRKIFKALHKLKEEYKPISEAYLQTELDALGLSELDLLEVIAVSPLMPSREYKEMLVEYRHKRALSETLRSAMYSLQRSSALDIATRVNKETGLLAEQMMNTESNNLDIIDITSIEEQPVEFVGINYVPLPRNSVVLLAGKGGIGKSGIALQSAIKHIMHTGEKVFCWLSEDPLGETKNRANKLCKQLGISLEDLAGKLYITNRRTFNIAIKDRDNIMTNPELLKLQDATKDFGLIVLDPLRSFASNFDENSNTDMDNVTKEFAQWAKTHKKIIMLIHHASKDGDIRGASSIVDASRLAYIVQNGSSPSVRNIEIRKDNFGVKKLVNGDIITVNSIKE